MTYEEFLRSKEIRAEACGFDIDRDSITPYAFDYQKDIITWACKKGRCAILTGCGTGKTLMLLEWCRAVHKQTNKPVLIVSPLSVVNQTQRESQKFEICAVNVCRKQEDVINGVNITNYEMIEHFDGSAFAGVCLDESSILKSFTGKYQQVLTEMFCKTPYRLLCTATIAPNDYTEIGTSCEFLGIMSRTEMLATYFIHDSGDTSKWRLKKAGVDTTEAIKMFDSDSIDMEIYSPPFSSLYTYSNSDRDLGNCKDDDEFFLHFSFITKELFRILKPGRIMAVHCMNLPTSKEKDGYIGIRDFRGDLIRAFQDVGFIYHAEVCIWKNPVTAMQRTKALGLLHKQLKKDSCMSRMGIPDYVVFMRKPGENPNRVTHTNESFPVSDWQEYASPIWDELNSPVWWDINQSDTLNARAPKDDESERHLCPLQIPIIERCLRMYTNPGDVVFTPFLGIGSEVYTAIKMGRKGIGIELKPAYFDAAVENIRNAEMEMQQETLFDMA